MISLPAALDDPKLFGPWFEGPSWNAWRAVLKPAFGAAMSDDELELFRRVAERDPPRNRVRELWIIGGRRAGKDSVASAIAAWAAAGTDYRAMLRPGEQASVLCLACDRQQARIVLRYTRAYFAQNDMLGRLVTGETADGLTLSTRAELMVATNSFRSIRGRTIACVILDECAFWRDEQSASPDVETYNAIVPGLATIPGSMMIGISSPYRRGGLLYQKWKDHYGKADDDVLVIRAPSRALNPTLDPRIIDEALARDPAVARAEWLAEWRDDIATFLSRELIESAVDLGVTVRPPVAGVSYRAFCDPSGGMSDSFTCGIAHAEGEIAVLDCLLEIRAPFNPATATGDVAKTLKSYGLAEVVGDRYAASWVINAFSRHGVRYTHSERDRSAIYADALPLFTSGRARILDNRKLVAQIAGLERRTASFGRDRIDHPAGGHDDLSNSAAGALVLLGSSGLNTGFIDYYQWLARGGAGRSTWPTTSGCARPRTSGPRAGWTAGSIGPTRAASTLSTQTMFDRSSGAGSFCFKMRRFHEQRGNRSNQAGRAGGASCARRAARGASGRA